MIKEIPPMLSFSRIGISLILPFIEVFSPLFLLLVAVAALTDVFDGIISRRMGFPAEKGRMLDSIADGFFVVSLLICIIPNIVLEDWMIIWIAALAIFRIIAIAVGSIRFGKAAFLHSYLNKATSAGIYLSPVLIAFIGVPATIVILGILATVSTMEHFYYNLTSDEYDPNAKGVFFVKKN
ncbi:MAG: CDP-alcohol phosphatidyltransferase family protein [Candidatus Methanomethylophilaceae archaeon]|nr:CDP-alcohol phosphatidyltransferase family protein [Candidatus Methanomethylophilaceae archaeon]